MSDRREYGSGSVYFRKSDARWVGTIEAGYTRTGARRRITVTGKTEAEAKRKLRDKRAKIEREGLTDAGSRTTVKAWAATWLADRATKDRPKTHTTDRGAVEAWIVPTIGHKRLEQLTPADVRAVSTALRQAGKSTSTMKRYHGVLIRMLKAAVLEGVNVPPRCLAVEPPAAATNDRTALTVPESLAVLEVASHLPNGSRWAVAFLDGLRQGEALGLTWPEVDLDAEQATISWQMQALPYLDKRDLSPDDPDPGFRDQPEHPVGERRCRRGDSHGQRHEPDLQRGHVGCAGHAALDPGRNRLPHPRRRQRLDQVGGRRGPDADDNTEPAGHLHLRVRRNQLLRGEPQHERRLVDLDPLLGNLVEQRVNRAQRPPVHRDLPRLGRVHPIRREASTPCATRGREVVEEVRQRQVVLAGVLADRLVQRKHRVYRLRLR